MATNSDPIQLVLQKLASIEASNEALQQTLAQQEARHYDEITALRKDFAEQLAIVKQSASHSKKVRFETEDQPASKDTPKPESGSSPSQINPITTRSPSEPTKIESDKLPDPPAFTGRKKDLPLFLTKLRDKLKGNADRFPDEEARLIYAHSRLDHDPATLVDPLMNKDICTVEQLLSFLQATYGDPNRELTAWSRLDNLKQGKKSFLTHFAEFRRLIANTNLNEGAQINELRRSLSDDLRRAMVGVPIPSSLNEYANLIALHDNDLRYLPAARYTVSSPRQARTPPRHPDAMEIDTNYAPVGSKEREERKRKGMCFKCGKHGHISRDCPVPLPQARSSSNPALARSVSSPTRSRRRSDSTSPPRRSRRSRSRSSERSRKGSSRR